MANKFTITPRQAAAALGFDQYSSPELVAREVARKINGAESEFEQNVVTGWEESHRDGALFDLLLEAGIAVAEQDVYSPSTGIHAPDVLITDSGVPLVVKCPYALRDAEDPDFTQPQDEPRVYARLQVLMMAMDVGRAFYYQWAPNGTMVSSVKRDAEWIRENGPALNEFISTLPGEISNPEHMEPLRAEINTDETNRLMEEMAELDEAIDQAKGRKQDIMARLIELANGKNACFWGQNLTLVKRKGPINYSKAVKDLAPGADLEQYRGKPSESWRMT